MHTSNVHATRYVVVSTVLDTMDMMWWLNDDEAPTHACTKDCVRIVQGAWVCRLSGVAIGPAALGNQTAAPVGQSRKPGSAVRVARFVTAAQQLMRLLLNSDRRIDLETLRTQKGTDAGMKAVTQYMASTPAEKRTMAGCVHTTRRRVALCCAECLITPRAGHYAATAPRTSCTQTT